MATNAQSEEPCPCTWDVLELRGWKGLEVTTSLCRGADFPSWAAGCSALSACRGTSRHPQQPLRTHGGGRRAGIPITLLQCMLRPRPVGYTGEGQDHACPQAFTTQCREKQEWGKKNSVTGGRMFVFGLLYKVYNKIINHEWKKKNVVKEWGPRGRAKWLGWNCWCHSYLPLHSPVPKGCGTPGPDLPWWGTSCPFQTSRQEGGTRPFAPQC